MTHPLVTPLDAAEMFTARGWVVFPADHPDAGTHCTGTARACREQRCKAERDPAQRGKHPRVRWGEITTPADSATLRRWFGRDAVPANVAIACGPSGLLIVDEDEPGAFARFCASVGHRVPDTFTVQTYRGLHYYFTVPTDVHTGERVPVGNAPGALAAWHCDVRGGASASAERGGYVITAGSTHASGIVYTAPDPYREALEAPEWLIEAILSGPPATAEGVSSRTGHGGEAAGTLRTSDGARWDDAPRYGSADDLLGQFARHCDEVAHEGGAFRHELFLAARDGWRCVALGLLDEPTMLRTLDACVWRVWAAENDERDDAIVFGEAQPAAAASPWVLTGPARPAGPVPAGRTFLRTGEAAQAAAEAAEQDDDGSFDAPALTSGDDPPGRTTHGNLPVVDVTDGEQDEAARRYARKLIQKIEDERLRRDARAALDAEGAPEFLRVCASRRKDRPRVSYLVPGMLTRNGLACLFGASMSGKTYFILDIGLTFATGRQWRGHRLVNADGTRGMVHYVMAEGEDTNNLRIDAWLYHHGLTNDDIEDTFVYFPQKVMLTEAGIQPYLKDVREDKPDLIVLDTRNLMFAGRESQGEDYAEMLNALHILQREAGGCCIVLIDHIGLNNDDRPRGNNAQQGGMDTEVKVSDEDGLRTAEVTKDRSAPLGTYWHYRLLQIPEVSREAHVEAPAVVVEAEREVFISAPDWWLDELPENLAERVGKATGEGKRAALDVVRVLRKARVEEGLTRPQIFTLVSEKPGGVPARRGRPAKPVHSRSSVFAAVTLLIDIAAVETTGAGKITLALDWR